MTAPNRHRIQRQVIDLKIGAGSAAPALQAQLVRSYWERTVAALESVFDRAASPNETLRLDHLDIDLGEIAGADWEPAFRSKLVAELTRKLAQFKAVPQAGAAQGRDPARPAGRLELFVFFLTHGRLPWWGTPPGDSWDETVLPALDEAGDLALRNVVACDSRARVRLVDAMSDSFLEAALSRWAALPHAAQVLERLTPQGLSTASRGQWRRRFWIRLLDRALAERIHLQSGPGLLSELLVLRSTLLDRPEGAAQHGRDLHASHPPAQKAYDSDTGVLPQPWQEWQRAAEAAELLEPASRVSHALAATDGAPRLAAEAARGGEGPQEVTPRPEDAEAVYLDGAGAVLLHPFLEELFRDRGLLAGRDFRDTAARHKAVHLLGWLGFGRVELPEYELLLAKVLCGCLFEEPLEPVYLDDDDTAACDALLRAVLTHWTALRSSSPEWLRDAFFRREGKLERVEQGWRLTVERHAQDVLLSKLPWGFGVVKLPWLYDMVFVQWLE